MTNSQIGSVNNGVQMTLFLQEDSHVSPTVLPEKEKAKMTLDTSGLRCLELSEKFNRLGLWAKTFTALLIGTKGWSLKKSALIWKMKATKYNRIYYQLVPLALPTEEIEFGLLPTEKMLPTPTTRDWKGKQASEYKTDRGEETEFMMESLPGWAEKNTGKTSQLSPQFVLEMMGFPTDWTLLPFLSGETSQSKQEEMQ